MLKVDGIDLDELMTYMEPVIKIRERKEVYSHLTDSSKYYLYPMKVCEIKDFESRGYNVTEDFKKVLRNRLCPNVPDDAPEYIVKNLY